MKIRKRKLIKGLTVTFLGENIIAHSPVVWHSTHEHRRHWVIGLTKE